MDSYFLCQQKIIDEYNSLYFSFAINKQDPNDIFVKNTAEIKNIKGLKGLIDQRITKKTNTQLQKKYSKLQENLLFMVRIGALFILVKTGCYL